MSENIFDILVDFVKIRHETLVSDLLSVVCEEYSPYKNFIEKIKGKFRPRENCNIQVYNYIDNLEETLTNLDLSKLYNDFINLCYKNNDENKEYLLLLIFLNSLCKYSDNSYSFIQNIYKNIIQYASKKLNIYFIDFNISKNCKLLQLYSQGGAMSDLSLVQILFVIHLVSFYYYNIKFEDEKNDKYNDLLNYDIDNGYKLLMVFMFIKDDERINNYLFLDIYNRNHNIFNSFILSICLSLNANYLTQNIKNVKEFLISQINPQKGFDENIIEQIDKHLNTLNNFIDENKKNWTIKRLNEIMSSSLTNNGKGDPASSGPFYGLPGNSLPYNQTNGQFYDQHDGLSSDGLSSDGLFHSQPHDSSGKGITQLGEEIGEIKQDHEDDSGITLSPADNIVPSPAVSPRKLTPNNPEEDNFEVLNNEDAYIVFDNGSILYAIHDSNNKIGNEIKEMINNTFDKLVNSGVTNIEKPDENQTTSTIGDNVVTYINSNRNNTHTSDIWSYYAFKDKNGNISIYPIGDKDDVKNFIDINKKILFP